VKNIRCECVAHGVGRWCRGVAVLGWRRVRHGFSCVAAPPFEVASPCRWRVSSCGVPWPRPSLRLRARQECPKSEAPPPPTVVVADVLQKTVPICAEYVGCTEALIEDALSRPGLGRRVWPRSALLDPRQRRRPTWVSTSCKVSTPSPLLSARSKCRKRALRNSSRVCLPSLLRFAALKSSADRPLMAASTR
jgi:hypothetical protein